MQTRITPLKTCQCCGFLIPKEVTVEQGKLMPCSEFHIRCVRCTWPVAKTMISPEGLCYECMDGNKRKAYRRKSGRLLYGKADGSTDPKDYLMDGRMQIHGDEETLLLQRRTKYDFEPR